MARPRGILNKNALKQLQAAAPSGLLRVRINTTTGDTLADVFSEVAQLQKNSAFIPGAGRQVVLKGNLYIPSYNTTRTGSSVPVNTGSGYLTQTAGVYLVQATVAVSGVPIEMFAGSVTVDNTAVSGTTSFSPASALGSAIVNVRGIVPALSGQRLNVGVKSLHGNLTTVGVEDMVNAPAANLIVYKLPSEHVVLTN